LSHIQVQNPSASSVYTWATPDGHIVGPSTGPNIIADAPGSYIVTQRLSAACNPYAYDTVTIVYDPSCIPLDQNILNFKGVINNNITRLDWTIAQNQDVSYFEIERSLDGKKFDFISRTDADSEKTLSASYYSYDYLTHLSIQPALYYRLKIKKTNGNISYSKVIRIPYGSFVTKISIIPNPVHDMMQVTINANNNNLMEAYIYDMSGKAVRKIKTNLQVGTNVISIDQLSELQSGMYVVAIYTEGEIFRQKIVLIK
jgi:hypothetical protein